MSQIHPSAIIDPQARIADDAVIGPGCVISGPVSIGPGCRLRGLVWIEGRVTIGAGNQIYPNAAIGADPQDKRNDPSDPTEVVIGDNNIIREGVTIHRGTRAGGGVTRIGSDCMIMVGSHVGHDARIEDQVTLINLVTIAGHCRVERGAWLSGYSGLHQFTSVGRCAFTAAFSGSDRDIPPYARVAGSHPVQLAGVNVVGLRRQGAGVETVRLIGKMLERLYPAGTLTNLDRKALDELSGQGHDDPHAKYLLEFVQRSAAHRFGRQREAGRYAAASEGTH